MKVEKIRNYIASTSEGAILFDWPAFDNSIIGLTSEGQVVYDYQKMVEEYCIDNMCSQEEAEEFIYYNTIRMLPYLYNRERKPVVITDRRNEE